MINTNSNSLNNDSKQGKENVLIIRDGFNIKTNILHLLRNTLTTLKESINPTELVNAINNLRRLFKFHQELFVFCFDNVYENFKKFLFNENQEVALYSFVLISEVFYEEWTVPEIRSWVEYLLPLVLQISSFEDHFIDPQVQNLCLTCLDLLACRGHYEETILVLLDGMANDNENFSTNASKALFTFITSCDKGFLLDGYDWNGIFELIIALWSKSKKRVIAEGFVNVLRGQVFSNEGEFEDLLSRLYDDILQNLLPWIKFNYPFVRNLRDLRDGERIRIQQNAKNEN